MVPAWQRVAHHGAASVAVTVAVVVAVAVPLSESASDRPAAARRVVYGVEVAVVPASHAADEGDTACAVVARGPAAVAVEAHDDAVAAFVAAAAAVAVAVGGAVVCLPVETNLKLSMCAQTVIRHRGGGQGALATLWSFCGNRVFVDLSV
jgi:hypothetical protein